MADYIIATSSTSDLTRDWLDEHGVPFIPYTYTVGSVLYEDDCREESRAAVYAGMRKGDILKTSMINEVMYCDFFRKLMETGKDVIFLDMSEKMSVSYKNALNAAEQVRAEYPTQTLYVMDTLCISGGLGMLVQNMVSRMEEGMSFDDVIAWGEANKLKIAHRFTVDDLNYLKAGGRVPTKARSKSRRRSAAEKMPLSTSQTAYSATCARLTAREQRYTFFTPTASATPNL